MIHQAYTDYGASDAFQAAFWLAFFITFPLVSLIGYVIGAFLLSKVFDKAGVEGKWRAWVPIYNYLVLAKLGDFSPWVILGLFVASLIPVLQYLAGLALFVAMIMVAYRVNAKFGRDWPILLLFILGPLGQWIWLGILGFSSDRWNPNIQPSPWANSFLADKTVWNGIPVQPGQQAPSAPAAGYGAPAGYAPPAQPYSPPAAGQTPPPPPAAGQTPPPAGPTPPAGPQA